MFKHVSRHIDIASLPVQEEDAKQAFESADLDKGGTLDREEVRALAISLGVTDEADLDKAIHQMDADGDDEITKEEFSSWWISQASAAATGTSSLFGRMKLVALTRRDIINVSAEAIAKMDDRDVRKVAVQKAQRFLGKMTSPRLSLGKMKSPVTRLSFRRKKNSEGPASPKASPRTAAPPKVTA